MKLHLTSAYDDHRWLDHLIDLAGRDVRGRHQHIDCPDEADVILFVENAHFDDYLFVKLRNHPLVQRYRHKVFMYNELDKPVNALPGLYCSMPRQRFHDNSHVAFPYLWMNSNRLVATLHQQEVERRWLFSFVGSMSHRLRRQLFATLQSDPRGHLLDTSGFNVWNASETEQAIEGQKFADAMAGSHFVLCPRGIGTSSFRPFEAMQAGRAPVIISNYWVPPPQVDWSFAVFIPEQELDALPERLAALEDEAIDRGRAARAAWEAAYADEVLFDTVAEALRALLLLRRQHPSPREPLWEPLREWAIGAEVQTLEWMRRLRRLAS